mmetsp:Transcript_14473/g.43152  ORF Transcript_14473/g.43152 Transcript_14473/m.43152 type:complete len:233 (+) Transcript_14473:620-1318(+)
MVAIRDVFEAVAPRKEMPSSGAEKRLSMACSWITGLGSSGSPSVFGFLASFSPCSAWAALKAVTSSKFSASSSFTGSPSMFCRSWLYFTRFSPELSWSRSSTANSKRLANGFEPSSREPSAVRSAREICSRRYCRNSPESCCLPEENSGCCLPMSERNICGATISLGSSSSSPSFHGGAYRSLSRPLTSLDSCVTRSVGASVGAFRRISRLVSRYRARASGSVMSSWTVEFM